MSYQVILVAQLSLVAVWVAVWVYYAYLLTRALSHRLPGTWLLTSDNVSTPGLQYLRRARPCGIALIAILAVVFALQKVKISACQDAGGRWGKGRCHTQLQ
jgi:hypothetical protein